MADEQQAQPEEGTPHTARKPGRRLRWAVRLGIFVPGLIVVLVLFGLVALPTLFSPEDLRVRAETFLTGLLRVPVEIGALDYHPLSGARLQQIRVGAPEGYTRDLARIEAVRVSYDLRNLLDRRVSLRALTVVGPHFVIETRDGVRNVDWLKQAMATDDKPVDPSEPEPAKRDGPVSPFGVKIDRIRIEDLGLEVVGEGPQVSLQGINVELQASVDSKRIDAHIASTARRPDAALPILRAHIPPRDGAPATSIEGALDLAVTATLAADASRGLTLENVALGLHFGLRSLRIETDRTLPPLDVGFDTTFQLDPAKDTVAHDLALSFGGAPIARARLELDGVVQVMSDVLGAPATELLQLQTGLKGSRRPGQIRLSVPFARLPLDVLQPYAAVFAPGVQISGDIGLGPVDLHATVPELRATKPRTLDALVTFERVSAALSDAGPSVARIDGKLRTWLEPRTLTSTITPIHLAGDIDVRDVHSGPHRIARVEVGLAGKAQYLTHPRVGDTSVQLDVKLTDARTPTARVPHLMSVARVSGRDVLADTRDGLGPIDLSVEVRSSSIAVGTGTQAMSLQGLVVAMQAGLDRLTQPATAPITATMNVALASVNVPGQATRVSGVALKARARTDDPRSGKPINPSMQAGLRVSRISRPDATISDSSVTMSAQAVGVAAIVSGEGDPLPRTVTSSIVARLPDIALNHPATGAYQTSARMETRFVVRPRAQKVEFKRAVLRLDEVIVLTLGGKVTRIFAETPALDLLFKLQPVDLSKLLARAPQAIREKAPEASASGHMQARLQVGGKLPKPGVTVEPAKSPVDIDLRVTMKDVTLAAPSQWVEVSDCDGSLVVDVGGGRAWVNAQVDLAGLSRRKDGADLKAKDVAVRMNGGLRGKTWSMRSTLNAGELAAGDALGVARSAMAEFHVRYPRFGDLEIRRVSLSIPDSGIDMSMNGRLSRRRFGALRPELAVTGRLDFDRLKQLVPEAGNASGQLQVNLQVSSPDDELLDLAGALSLDRFSVETPTMRMTRATGRLPFEQRLLIPAPGVLEGAQAQLGALGDDFEARLQLLVDELEHKSKLVVDASDIFVDAPQTADYQALRPYYVANDARLQIDEVVMANEVFGTVTLGSVSLDGLYRMGVVRLDRLTFQLWEGDVFGDMAFQLGGEDDVRLRMRVTATDINLDVPLAPKLGLERAGEGAHDWYLFSGVSDIKFDVGEQLIDGNVDVTKMDHKLVIRLVDAVDPEEADVALQSMRLGLAATLEGALGWLHGERPAGMKVWIRQNLLNQSFVWSSPWFGLSDFGAGRAWAPQLVVPFLRIVQEGVAVTSENLFGYRVNFMSIRGAVPGIRRRNLAEVWANPVWKRLDTKLEPLHGRVVTTEQVEADRSNPRASR